MRGNRQVNFEFERTLGKIVLALRVVKSGQA